MIERIHTWFGYAADRSSVREPEETTKRRALQEKLDEKKDLEDRAARLEDRIDDLEITKRSHTRILTAVKKFRETDSQMQTAQEKELSLVIEIARSEGTIEEIQKELKRVKKKIAELQ